MALTQSDYGGLHLYIPKCHYLALNKTQNDNILIFLAKKLHQIYQPKWPKQIIIIIIKYIYYSALTSKAIQGCCTIKSFMPKDI